MASLLQSLLAVGLVVVPGGQQRLLLLLAHDPPVESARGQGRWLRGSGGMRPYTGNVVRPWNSQPTIAGAQSMPSFLATLRRPGTEKRGREENDEVDEL